MDFYVHPSNSCLLSHRWNSGKRYPEYDGVKMIIPYAQRFYDTNKWHGVISWGMPMQVCKKIVAKAFDATGRMFEDERFEYNWRRTADVGYERGSYLFWWTRNPKLMAVTRSRL
jgi:hypothetical protein